MQQKTVAASTADCRRHCSFAGTLCTVGFSLPDAVRWRDICYDDVAVCVSVELTYCAQTTEAIIMRPLPDCSPVTLVFPHQI